MEKGLAIRILAVFIAAVVMAGAWLMHRQAPAPQPENTVAADLSNPTRYTMNPTIYTMPNGYQVYIYGRKSILEGSTDVPMVLFLNGTGGDPQQETKDAGWIRKTEEEDIIVVSPEYNDGATYSEVDYLVDVITRMKQRYPIDASRVYSLGFSNGGATSVVLTAEHPELLAGIAAYGWQVDLANPKDGYTMPFQIIQGTDEASERDARGNPTVRTGTRESLRSLLRYNGMIGNNDEQDFSTTPYWGYVPDNTRTDQVGDANWTINDYRKAGYTHPFAQFILIENGIHEPHWAQADYSWDFLRHHSRVDDTIVED